MSHWDYIDLPRPLRQRGISVAAHENGPKTECVKLEASDEDGSVVLLLDAFDAKELGKALFEAGYRAEWNQITQRGS